MGEWEVPDPESINEAVIRLQAETFNGTPHGEMSRAEDVEPIHFRSARRGDCPTDFRVSGEPLVEDFPFRWADFFRIIQSETRKIRWQDDGCRRHRPRQWTSPRFVDSSNDEVSLLLECEFEREVWHRLLADSEVIFVPGLSRTRDAKELGAENGSIFIYHQADAGVGPRFTHRKFMRLGTDPHFSDVGRRPLPAKASARDIFRATHHVVATLCDHRPRFKPKVAYVFPVNVKGPSVGHQVFTVFLGERIQALMADQWSEAVFLSV